MNNLTHYTVFGHVDKDDSSGILLLLDLIFSDNDLRIQFIDFLLQKYPTQLYVIDLNSGVNPKYWSHTFLNKDVIIDYVVESSCPMVVRDKKLDDS